MSQILVLGLAAVAVWYFATRPSDLTGWDPYMYWDFPSDEVKQEFLGKVRDQGGPNATDIDLEQIALTLGKQYGYVKYTWSKTVPQQ